MNKLDESGKARLNWAREGIRNRPQLLSRLMNFFFVLMEGDYRSNKRKNNYTAHQNKISHNHASLSIIKAKMKSSNDVKNPRIIFGMSDVSGEIKSPKTWLIKTSLPKSSKIREIFSLCFFVNLISEILSKAKMLVKSPSISPLSRGRGPKDRRGCVLKYE